MKKVLIIANLFHSSPRVPEVVKYLSEFGWEPTILTIPAKETPQNYSEYLLNPFKKDKIIKTPYQGDIFWLWRKIFRLFGFDMNKSILNQTKEKTGITSQKSFIDFIFNFYQAIFGYPDDEKGWEKPALKTADKLFEKEKFDAIISSSSPVTVHIIASKLKDKYKIPWLADFRDLWTQNHNYSYPWWRKIFEEKLELRTILPADALITVSYPWAEKMKILHKKEEIYTITNGFDPENINFPPIPLTEKFTITYTGQIYTEKQDPLKILVALKDLISNGTINPNDVEIRFYGPEYLWLQKEIEKYKLSSVVKQYGIISKEVSLKKQWESQILLLLNWEDKQEKGVYPGKVFEYLVAQRPILATGGFGLDVVEKLLNETETGAYISTIDGIKKSLIKFYLEYKQKGKISFKDNLEIINKYSAREMAKGFVNILNKLSND